MKYVLIFSLLLSPAFAHAKDEAKKVDNAISEAWGNTKKLVSKKKKENCTETAGHTDCSVGAKKLKKHAKNGADAMTK